jgi:hypothetical protein
LKPKAVIPPLKPLKPIIKDIAGEILMREESKQFEKKNDKMDIKDLSWEEKEKILRVLFAKMNGVSLGTEKKPSKELQELKEASKLRDGFANVLEKESNIAPKDSSNVAQDTPIPV